MIKTYALACILGLASGPTGLYSSGPDPHIGATEIASNDVVQALHFASTYSRYSFPWFARPRAYVLPNARFDAIFCGPHEFYIGPCGILAATESREPHNIYVRQSDTKNPQEFQQTLVHEMVHWLQMTTGWGWNGKDCFDVSAHELEAYTVAYVFELRVQNRREPFWLPNFGCGGGETPEGESWK